MTPWEERAAGPFRVGAGPAVDGLGDPQLSWGVESGGCRVFHGGDTVFHGHWWSIARRSGPGNIAFAPINGAVVELLHRRPPSPFRASMLPEEAVVAAQILGARVAAPSMTARRTIPRSTWRPRGRSSGSSSARELGITPAVTAPGEWFTP